MGGTGWVGVQLSQIVLSELRPSALAKEEQSKELDVKNPLSWCGIPRFNGLKAASSVASYAQLEALEAPRPPAEI